mgnify:CR=1 FL=1
MQCPICLSHYEQLDEHHIYPKAFGGPQDGELFDLCSTCHQAIHSQAKAMSAKKWRTGKKIFYLQPEPLKRAEFLIYAIMQAQRNYKLGIVPEGGDGANHEVSFRVDRVRLELLHSAKERLGFKSIQQMMDLLINEIIGKTHGVIPDNTQGSHCDPRILRPGQQRRTVKAVSRGLPAPPDSQGRTALPQGDKKPV